MADRVRVGMVGTSRWADAAHLPGLHSHPQADLLAVCGRNAERAEEIGRKYGIPRTFTDYRAMLEQADLDALVVAAPDDLHYQITMDALDLGLHILCEKPLALTAEQARAMYDKAETAGVKHMTMFTYRWVPEVRYLRELIDTGYLGRPFHCYLSFLAGHARAGQYRWRFDAQRANGALGDLGSHMIDLARWLVADIARVNAHLPAFVNHPGPDDGPGQPANDAAVLMLEFVNGAQGLIQVSAVAHVADRRQEQHYVLHGQEGMLELDLIFARPADLRGARHDEPAVRSLPVPERFGSDLDPTNPFEGFTKHPVGARLFVDTIVNDLPPTPSFYDGYKAQQVIDAAMAADRQGVWRSLES